MNVGVLALQGAFALHVGACRALGHDAFEVRTQEHVARCDALILPGGESTTMSMLLESSGLFDPLSQAIAAGLPVFGTCAGMILLGHKILEGRDDQRSFSAIDIDVSRNAYGRQLESFEAGLTVEGLQGVFPAVFIRAPRAVRVGDQVEVLATYDDDVVLCRQGSIWAAAFHPELAGDYRVHDLFLRSVVNR